MRLAKSTITAAASTGGVPPGGYWRYRSGRPRRWSPPAGSTPRSRKALRLAEPRALANQQDHHLRAEDLADLIFNLDAAIAHEERRPDLQTRLFQAGKQRRQDLFVVGGDGIRRQAIGDHHLHIRIHHALRLQRINRFRTEATAHIRTRQVEVLIANLGTHFQQPLRFHPRFRHLFEHRVFRARVIGREAQQRLSARTRAGAAGANARRGTAF